MPEEVSLTEEQRGPRLISVDRSALGPVGTRLPGPGHHSSASVGVAPLYVLRESYFRSEGTRRMIDSLEGFCFVLRGLRMSFSGKASAEHVQGSELSLAREQEEGSKGRRQER